MRKSSIALAALLMLAGCGDEPASTDLTAEEKDQLNEAAAMLDASAESLITEVDETIENAGVPLPEEPGSANQAAQ